MSNHFLDLIKNMFLEKLYHLIYESYYLYETV